MKRRFRAEARPFIAALNAGNPDALVWLKSEKGVLADIIGDIDPWILIAYQLKEHGIEIGSCQECGKYFCGDPRRKWCSNTCGSRVRQQNARRR